MPRMLLGAVLAMSFLAASGSSARADWWGYPYYSSGSYYVSYYYPVNYYPVYYYYPQPITCGCPAPVVRPAAAANTYAQPKPAPASTAPATAPSKSKDKEPVTSKKSADPPNVSESQTYSLTDKKGLPTAVEGAGKEDCRVGFWNVSGRDVKLTIGGKTYDVARDHNLTLSLGRSFDWKIDNGEVQTEAVPGEMNSHEIVIRK